MRSTSVTKQIDLEKINARFEVALSSADLISSLFTPLSNNHEHACAHTCSTHT